MLDDINHRKSQPVNDRADVGGREVLAHLTLTMPDYYADQTQRDRVVELADYLARKLDTQRPDEASSARVLRELVKNQRLG
jgi:putative DNA methylase